MAAYSDFLQTPVNGVLTPTIGVYVQLVSNNTALGYVSDTATDTKGKFTFNTKPPGDVYTVYTNIAHLAPLDAGWTLAGDAAYAVPIVAGETPALSSVTTLSSGPYVASAPAGSIMAVRWLMPSGDTTGATDAAALQAALTACGNAGSGKVELGNTGTPFWVNAISSIPSHVTLDLGGATIKLATNANCDILRNSDTVNGNVDIVIRNGWLDGNKVNQSAGITELTHCGVHLFGVSDSLVDAVKVQQCKNHPIFLDKSTASGTYCDRVQLRSNWWINSVGYPAIYGNRLQVIGCVTYKSETINADSFNVGGDNTTSGCIFVGCIAYNPGGGLGDGWAMDGLNEGLVESCWTYNTEAGARMYNNYGNDNVRIIGNKFYGQGLVSTSQFGILADARTGSFAQTPNVAAGGYTIAHNHVENFQSATTGYGIFIAGGPGDVYGNTFKNCRTPVAYFGAGVPVPSVRVTGNRNYNPVGALTAPSMPATGVAFSNPFSFDCTVNLTGGIVTAVGLGGLSTPVNATHTTVTTGGTLVPGTYWYRISALNSTGETLASTQTSIVVPAGTNTNAVDVIWNAVPGAIKYNVYGRTTGAELLMATTFGWGAAALGSSFTAQWRDDGSITPAGALPGADTTGNTATGLTAGSFALPWGSAIKLTYTGLPTWTWFGN